MVKHNAGSRTGRALITACKSWRHSGPGSKVKLMQRATSGPVRVHEFQGNCPTTASTQHGADREGVLPEVRAHAANSV